jgi:hypothetical protein
MNGPNELQPSSPKPRRAPRAPRVPGSSGPTSFARALGQRGLLSSFDAGSYVPAAGSAASGFWLGMASIYESHLRRVAMEQAFAMLRDRNSQRN